MLESPQDRRLTDLLRSSKLVAGGFMGRDRRSVAEIIAADSAELSRLRLSAEELAERMQRITDDALEGLGTWVKVSGELEARVDEAKGWLVCPWPHPGRFAKRVTTVRSLASEQSIFWSDLNIHLIRAHGFFEGKGSAFRIEPAEVARVTF